MKNPSPRQVALYASATVSIIMLVVLVLAKRFYTDATSWYLVFLFPAGFFPVAFLVIYYFMEQFIYRKIKLIYKIIYNFKSPKGTGVGKVKLQSNVIPDTEQEVLRWVKSKKQEIEQLKKLEAYRREFLGNVSHELKTPIFNIQGYLETLIDSGLKDEQINMKYLQKASRNVERLNDILKDLQMITNIEEGKFELKIELFDIYELTKEVFASFEMQADLYNIKLKFKEGCDKSFMVAADKQRIRQVMINLISNSLNYGKDGGETVVGFYDMDKHILIEVSDNGLGIDKEHLPRLFERFYRVDKNRSREKGGTGLGLSIVKHIIEAHNETINVRSTPGVGSTFGFTLAKNPSSIRNPNRKTT